jgi:hypothetical protein
MIWERPVTTGLKTFRKESALKAGIDLRSKWALTKCYFTYNVFRGIATTTTFSERIKSYVGRRCHDCSPLCEPYSSELYGQRHADGKIGVGRGARGKAQYVN